MLRPGDIVDQKYKILELIGEGGMAKVWLARDEKLGKLWAIKEISKVSRKFQFLVDEDKTLKELEIMKNLNHPALPRIVDVIDEEYTLSVVMDYIEGDTLENLLETYGVQSEEVVASWMIEVCDILTYLHSLNPPIIYKDLKPANLMLDREGHIRIIDFGIAKKYSGNKGDTTALGTNGYASPEHHSGYTDARSDVYSLGATTYRLVTGMDPEEPPCIIYPIRKINPKLSQGLEKIVAKATRPDPNERYQTAAEMANALDSFRKLDDEYIDSLRRKISRFKRMLVYAAALFVVGIALTTSSFVIDRNTYDTLAQSPGGTLSAKEESLDRAISINPKKEDAYLALIEAYAEDGKFTEEESERFFKVYNAHKGSISGDTNYKIGEAYLRYYTGETDSSARAKLLTAEPFFLAVDEDSDYKKLADGYAFLAEYYRSYVMADDSLLTGAETEKDYKKMLAVCKDTMSSASNDKMRSIMAEAALNLISSQRDEMKKSSIPEKDVLDVIALAESVPDPAIKKQTKETREGVQRTYHPKKEG